MSTLCSIAVIGVGGVLSKSHLTWGKGKALNDSCLLPSGGESAGSARKWEVFVDELKQQWRTLWRERINDRVRAEGISNKDFNLLFVDRGTVIVATKCYKPPDFKDILEQYGAPYEVKTEQDQPSPEVGGWRKFGRGIAAVRGRRTQKQRFDWSRECRGKAPKGQLKKGGRGWLHVKMR
jgi:hypothetical protein